ncbi:hypothetical protein C7293_02685 [filamentous cyanobacterium CCT1]|nr:hypothetical protein C7293_02685 [filamentous cyanobacterium CCT1]PSN81619.1 hypothetical protein C8B47_00335 [filamentous cyanobacterium CCP4]
MAFSSVFFSRVLDTLGAPSIINFAHFALVPLATWVALTKTRIRDREQREMVYTILCFIFIFLSVVLISTLVNNAGIINAILAFLLWVEPFFLLVAILCLPSQLNLISRLQKWILYAFVFHTLLAFVQHYVLHLYRLPGLEDNIQGVFYRSGSGHVVGASVALDFGVYWLFTGKQYPLWLRSVFLLAAFWHMLLSDAKQVLLYMLVGGVLLLLSKLKNLVETIKCLAVGAVVGLTLHWCIQNLAAFSAFNTWMRPEIYGSDGEATLLKFSAFRIVPSFYQSSWNFLFGLGPGHTVDRLGGWMLFEYWNLLGPLGATTHPASISVWQAVGASWLGDQSSMFSPLFGWAAIWGDFGWIGLVSFFGLCTVVYLKVCNDDVSKYLMFTALAVGLIFSQLQEPGYTMAIALFIGFRWHEKRLFEAAESSQANNL